MSTGGGASEGGNGFADENEAGFSATEFLKGNHWNIDDVRYGDCAADPINEPSKGFREQKGLGQDDRHSPAMIVQQSKAALEKRDSKLLFDRRFGRLPNAIGDAPFHRGL